MFNFQDKNAENINVSVSKENTAVLNIAAFSIGGVSVPERTLDLSAYRGKMFRMYVENDGTFSTAIQPVHYWLLLEGMIPENEYKFVDNGTTDENGMDQKKMVEIPLDLNDVEFTVYALPEQAKED